MIDLGIDLDGYGDQEPAQPARPGQPQPQPAPDGGFIIPLADLQAAGFNTMNPSTLTRAVVDRLCDTLLFDDEPAIQRNRAFTDVHIAPPAIQFKTWLPGDA